MAGAEINAVNKVWRHLLPCAEQCSTLPHAPSSVRGQEKATLLHVAAEEGNARALQLLCELAPDMIRSRDIVSNAQHCSNSTVTNQ